MFAKHITTHTCVGFLSTDFPLERGNCFSVEADDGHEYRILNFHLENMLELEKQGLTWPVKMKTVNHKLAVIDDERIGRRWYKMEYCEACCPEELLPEPQRQAIEREYRIGIRSKSGNSITINCNIKQL